MLHIVLTLLYYLLKEPQLVESSLISIAAILLGELPTAPISK